MDILTMENLEEDDIEEPDNLVAKFAKRPCLTVCISCGLVGYGIFNIVFDWLWVDDMVRAEQGLVFGAPSSQIIATLIWIASIGTVSFIFEIVNVVFKIVKGTVFVHEDLNQILSLFLEEVPSVTLNFLLAACREVPVSYFQMVKAALAMVGAGLRCLKVLIKFITVRRRQDTKKGFIPLIIRLLILAACAYLLAGSIMTWIYTYSPDSDEDASGIKLPPNLVSKSYDSAKYFYKAGFYFSHPWFNDCNDNNRTWNNELNQNWIKLQSLVDFEDSEDEFMTVGYHYGDNQSIIITSMDDVTKCYSALADCTIVSLQNCSTRPAGQYQSVEFRFTSIEYTKTLVFGDIRFKAIHFDNQSQFCEELKVDHVGFLITQNDTYLAQLQYFKSRAHVNDTDLFVQNATYRYYMNPEDLFNVTDVWKTGYDQCEMTGSLAPNYEKNIQLPC